MLEMLLNLYKISIHIIDKTLKQKTEINDVILLIFFLLPIKKTCSIDLTMLYPFDVSIDIFNKANTVFVFTSRIIVYEINVFLEGAHNILNKANQLK